MAMALPVLAVSANHRPMFTHPFHLMLSALVDRISRERDEIVDHQREEVRITPSPFTTRLPTGQNAPPYQQPWPKGRLNNPPGFDTLRGKYGWKTHVINCQSLVAEEVFCSAWFFWP